MTMDYDRWQVCDKNSSKILGENGFSSEASGNFENNKFTFGISQLHWNNHLKGGHTAEGGIHMGLICLHQSVQRVYVHSTVIYSFARLKHF